MAAVILVDNDNNVTLQGYTLVATGVAVTDAEPSFTVYFNDGSYPGPPQKLAPVPGLSNISMSYYAATGIYAGLLPGTVLMTPGSQAWFYVVVSFSNYNDVFADWFQAVLRTSATG